MSETKKRGSNDASALSKSIMKQSKFCDLVKQLYSLVTEMKAEIGAAMEFEKTMENLKAMYGEDAGGKGQGT